MKKIYKFSLVLALCFLMAIPLLGFNPASATDASAAEAQTEEFVLAELKMFVAIKSCDEDDIIYAGEWFDILSGFYFIKEASVFNFDLFKFSILGDFEIKEVKIISTRLVQKYLGFTINSIEVSLFFELSIEKIPLLRGNNYKFDGQLKFYFPNYTWSSNHISAVFSTRV